MQCNRPTVVSEVFQAGNDDVASHELPYRLGDVTKWSVFFATEHGAGSREVQGIATMVVCKDR